MALAQQRMWFLHQLHPDSVAYHEPWAVELAGEVDADALNAALVFLVERHAALRSAFPGVQGVPTAILCDAPARVLAVEEIASGTATRSAIDRRIHEESTRPFDLEQGPLYRFLLLRGGPGCTVFLAVFHHIVMDGWSLNVLWRELAQAYAAYCAGRAPELPVVRPDAPGAPSWDDHQLEYWTSNLAGAPHRLELPTDHPRPAVLSERGRRTDRVALSAATREALSGFCRTHRVTPFMVLYAAFAALLQRYSRQRDLCIGTTAACRTTPELEDVVGLFVNTCALRTQVSPEQGFTELVRQVRSTVLGAWSHQEVPFDRVVDALRIPRTLGHAPLVQVMFTLHKEEHSLEKALSVASARPWPIERHGATFDLTLGAIESGRGIELELEFNTDLFEPATAQRMVAQYLELLDAGIRNPARPLQRLPLLTPAERKRVVDDFNDTSRPFDGGATVVSLFEEQARRKPEDTALVAPDRTLTFGELDAASSRLAQHLASRGAGPDARVGICLERTSDLVVALFAVLKTGAAYLPLEPNHPAARRAQLASQAGVRFIVGSPSSFEGMELSIPLVSPSDCAGGLAPLTPPSPESVAAVLYTSGSTGAPKGVELTHQNLVHAFESFNALYGASPGECWIASASVAFDIHFEDLVFSLSKGARVVLREIGPVGLAEDIARHGVTHLSTTPSLLSLALDEQRDSTELLRTLSVIVLGGEVLSPSLVQRLSTTRARVFNTYGPSEATVAVTAEEARVGTRFGLGRPLDRSRCYVLDEFDAPVPVGVPGELYIGGTGVGRGYLGRPDLTAERFVPDPFSSVPGARMYRTGDLVRWTEDGTLSFLGRADFQVKVRGVRVELEEVEAALALLPGISKAAVIARKDVHETQLIAFVVVDPDHDEAGRLRERLAQLLPDAMVPAHVEVLEHLPLNSNGKVDRRALEHLPLTATPKSTAGEPPARGTEEAIAQQFCQLLGVSELGRDASFFELGGNSLTAAQLAARLRRRFKIELSVATVFAQPTVASLARVVDAARPELPISGPTRRPESAPLVLSAAQERMWFLSRLAPDSVAYHVPQVLELHGAVDLESLRAALRKVLERHPILRSAFPAADGRPGVVLQPLPGDVLLVESRAGAGSKEDVDAWVRELSAQPFSLDTGPLYRFRLLRLGSDHHVLLLLFHHIVVDGISVERVLREVAEQYEAIHAGQQAELPAPALDFFDVAHWERTEQASARHTSQLEYWSRQLDGIPQLLELPTDFPRPAALGDKGGVTPRVRLRPELARAVRAYCRRERVTPFMALNAACAALLHRCSGQEDFCVGTPVAGRNHPSTEAVVGLFVNTVALRTRISPSESFADLVHQVRETTLNALAHQELPFDRVVEALRIPRSLSHAPVFQVMFDLQQEHPRPPFAHLRGQAREVDVGTAKFDLSFSVVEDPDGFELYVEYNSDLYERSSAERMVAQLITLLEQALQSPATPLSRLSLLDGVQQHRVLVEFNDTKRPFDAQATLASLFEAQVARTPESIAVVGSDATLTFRELDAKATRLARHLAALGAGPDSVVGLCLERTSELLVGLWGILKSGAAYLPLEPTHPPARRAELLRRAGACVVVTRPALFSEVDVEVPIVTPDATGAEATPITPRPEHLAVLLYTSGSTGEPKGVELTHRNIVHAFESFDELYATHPGDRWAASASISFDMHLEELLFSVTRGASIVLRTLGPQGLARDLRAFSITHAVTTPSSLAVAAEEQGAREAFQSLAVLVSGGEALPARLVEQLDLSRTRLVNSYGPTEITINATAQLTVPHQPVRLGRPLDRCTCYVLDASGAPVPVGVPGELFIGGAGVARGYRNRPDLTSERFLPDPFSSVPGARMYRSGDRVRWNDDGTLSFLGRTDFQVKVRGIRIELEEIEAALLRIPGVRHAAVLARKSLGQTRLDAFLVVDGLSSSDVRERLSASVPEAMVPARFTLVDALPFTASGKVDRKALADLPVSDPEPDAASEPPRGEHEVLITQLFAQLLGLEQIGRDDDFFALGGHSLSAIQLVFRIHRVLGVELPIASVFAHPSVAGLARVVQAAAPAAATLDGPVRRPADAPLLLSHAQERMWFLQQLQPQSTAYNVVDALELQGPVSPDALERALHLLVERHHALRLVVSAADGRPSPALLPLPERVLTVEDYSDQRFHSESTRTFDLALGPLFRFTLFRISAERHVLLIAFHHIVVDGLSLEILLGELSDAYAAFAQGRAPKLRPITLDYFDVAQWERSEQVQVRDDDSSSATGSSSSTRSPGSSSSPPTSRVRRCSAIAATSHEASSSRRN